MPPSQFLSIYIYNLTKIKGNETEEEEEENKETGLFSVIRKKRKRKLKRMKEWKVWENVYGTKYTEKENKSTHVYLCLYSTSLSIAKNDIVKIKTGTEKRFAGRFLRRTFRSWLSIFRCFARLRFVYFRRFFWHNIASRWLNGIRSS